jgi:hypothetical protein
VGFLFLPDPTAILYLLQDCSVKRSPYPASVDFRVSIFCIYSGDLLNRLVPDLAPSLRQFTDRLIRLGPGKFFSIFFKTIPKSLSISADFHTRKTNKRRRQQSNRPLIKNAPLAFTSVVYFIQLVMFFPGF